MNKPSPLYLWLLKPMLPVTILIGCWMIPFTLLPEETMSIRNTRVWLWWPALHVLRLSFDSSRVMPARAGFAQTVGYGRAVIARHIVLARLSAVLIVWLPVAAIYWLGIRSLFQQHLLNNPNFPVMAPLEFHIPILAMLNYLLFLGLDLWNTAQLHQPHAGRDSVKWLIAAIAIAIVTIENILPGNPWWLLRVSGLAAFIVIAITFRHALRLFPTMEDSQ